MEQTIRIKLIRLRAQTRRENVLAQDGIKLLAYNIRENQPTTEEALKAERDASGAA
jgi:hypothetical protein